MILKNGKRIDGMGDSMPIGSVIEYNGTDIPDGWEVLPAEGVEIYSTTETLIGTYANRPLYRIILTTNKGSLPNNTYVNIPHNIPNVDYIVSIKGLVFEAPITDDGWFYPIPYVSPTVGHIAVVGRRDVIQVEASMDLSKMHSNIIIDYTKTTD